MELRRTKAVSHQGSLIDALAAVSEAELLDAIVALARPRHMFRQRAGNRRAAQYVAGALEERGYAVEIEGELEIERQSPAGRVGEERSSARAGGVVRRPPCDVLHRGLTPALRGGRPPRIDMTQPQPNNPLHGVTLQMILEHLVAQHGWEQLGRMIDIRCFKYDPSIKSSLQFLRRTPWARQQVEALYLRDKAKPSP